MTISCKHLSKVTKQVAPAQQRFVQQYLRSAGAIEGVGFQNVSTSFQELIVNASNDIRAGDDQQVIVALQLMRMGLVAITSEVLLRQPAIAK